ncbi:hypothetical protein J5N97_028553 [Dioscorea zingiberensis]|uniref:Ribosomal RNA small subunit methyltransferase NEP1 n=1 Tax=Dioscorea zingiberensis TaxID=325984 RepID=A0A9D5BZA0_9LILI|nr:hypothetical protein J5N97_028553 [Dioscorea zingiberensis]
MRQVRDRENTGECESKEMELSSDAKMMLRHCSSKKKKKGVEDPFSTSVKKAKIGLEASVSSLQAESVISKEPRGVIFVIENAPLKKELIRKKWKILSSEDDTDFLVKQHRNLADYKPEFVYNAIRSILDSSFNKAGMVRAIYVKINNGVLFEVKPYVRLPRTCKRFCGIMVDFLQKARVCSGDGNEALLRVIEEPVTRHLPSNARIIGLSYGSEKLVNLKNYVSALNDDLNLVFVLGPMNCGDIKMDYVDEFISVSPYSMRVNVCLGTVCELLEKVWKKREKVDPVPVCL